MQLDWSALGEVAAVSTGVTVGVVVVFALGVLGWPARRPRGRATAAPTRWGSAWPGCVSWRARAWWRTGSI